jgi:RNA polymerase sigma factor (sigma-70 family)
MQRSPVPEDPRQAERELLVLRCRRGERAAWEELVARWERPLLYYLRRMARSEGEAVAWLQDTWVRVFTSLGTLSDPARLAAWLYTLARRVALRHLGDIADGRGAELDAEGEPDPGRDALREFEDAEAVHWGLARLAPAQREVLVLFFLEDLSLREIAEVLGIPVGTVKSRLHKARGELRSLLEHTEERHGTRS